MTKQEKKIVEIENRVDVLATKVDSFIEEMREFKKEVKESREEMRSIGRHVQNITIAAMVGIGALALSGGAIAVAVIYSVLVK